MKFVGPWTVNIYTAHCRKSTFAVTVYWTVTANSKTRENKKKKKKKKKEQKAAWKRRLGIQTHTLSSHGDLWECTSNVDYPIAQPHACLFSIKPAFLEFSYRRGGGRQFCMYFFSKCPYLWVTPFVNCHFHIANDQNLANTNKTYLQSTNNNWGEVYSSGN